MGSLIVSEEKQKRTSGCKWGGEQGSQGKNVGKARRRENFDWNVKTTAEKITNRQL